MKTSWSLLLAVVVCLSAGAVHAAPKRVGVPAFDGVQEALVRKKVMAALQAHGFELAKSRQIESTLQGLNTRLDSNDGFQALAKELALQAIVTGEVGKKRAKIVVYDGREGSAIGDATFAAANPKKLAAEVGRNFWKKLGAAVQKGHTPSNAKKAQKAAAEAPEDAVDSRDAEPEAEEAPASRKKAPVAAEGEAEGGKAAPKEEAASDEAKEKKQKRAKKEEDEENAAPGPVPPTLDVAAGGGILTRELAYNQPVSKLRSYKLPGGGAAIFNGIWYPLSYLTDGFIQHLGLELHIQQGFAISSTIGSGDADFPNGAKFNTVVHDYSGGLRFRIPFSGGHQMYLSGTAGEQAFVFRTASSDPVMSRGRLDIPDVIYHYFRPGIGFRFELPAELSLELAAGYRVIPNGGGQIKDVFFPHLSVGGADVSATLGYKVTSSIEIRAAFDLRRYFFAMNSKLDDASADNVAKGIRIAGGAIDQYLTFTGSVAFLMGGSEGSEPAAAAAPAKKRKPAADEESAGGEGGEDAGGGDEQ